MDNPKVKDRLDLLDNMKNYCMHIRKILTFNTSSLAVQTDLYVMHTNL